MLLAFAYFVTVRGGLVIPAERLGPILPYGLIQTKRTPGASRTVVSVSITAFLAG